MWTIYDRLIEEIPSNSRIKAVCQTERWTLIDSGEGIGTAMKFKRNTALCLADYQGAALQEVAALIKSWDFEEASLGLAAINSCINQRALVDSNFSAFKVSYQDAFDHLPDYAETEKIGMVGHFPFADRYPNVKKRLSIFELEPRSGDYPASAAEFLLPEMDRVYITASTIVNKTLPRLLELSKQAKTILVGSSCPLSPILLQEGITTIAGTCYNKNIPELLQKKEQSRLPLSKCGQPIMIEKRR